MPVMTAPVPGYTGLTQQVRMCLEPTPGEQVLMPQTAGASTMSLTTQPNTISPTTGMALHFFVIGNATAGSISIVGTTPSGGAQTSITYHVPIAPQNALGYTDFTTKETWGTITSSSITLTTLTPCQIIVFGSCGAKNLIPITQDAEEKIGKVSPPDKRGILGKNFRVNELTKTVSLDKFDSALYPDSLWAPYMLIGNTPSITTVPASAPSLLAATAKNATMTLTTQPSAPGMFLIFAIGNTNILAGTIVLSGLDNYGAVASETIIVPASGPVTLYSTKRYNSLTSSQFTTTGMTTGATIAVTGAYAFTFTWTYDGINNYNVYTAALEVYNGVFGYKMPYTYLSEGTFSWEKEKEISLSCKGEGQDYAIVGDPTSTSGGTNPFATLPQPTSLPMVSWPGTFFVDAGTGTPLTTQDGSFLTFKAQIMTGRKSYYNGDGSQRWSNVTIESEPDFSIDASVVLPNYQNYVNYFKNNQSLIFGASFQGNFLGSIGGSTYFENWTWTFPGKIDTSKNDMSKNPVEGAVKIMSEYNFSLGYYYKLAVTCQTPPTYTA